MNSRREISLRFTKGPVIVFYPKLFPDPYSVAPMFFRYPPFNHVKRFKGPPFLHNTQMVITNNIFFTLPFLLTVTSECANCIFFNGICIIEGYFWWINVSVSTEPLAASHQDLCSYHQHFSLAYKTHSLIVWSVLGVRYGLGYSLTLWSYPWMAFTEVAKTTIWMFTACPLEKLHIELTPL